MELNDWIQNVTAEASAQEISSKAGISLRTLQHQLSTGRMSLENKVRIATAFSHHPLRTLVEWGAVDAAWESVPDIEAALRLATDEQLTDEVLRRMKRGLASGSPLDTSVDDLMERRSQRSAAELGEYAADSSPVEPEPGDEGYHDGP